MKGIVFTEFLNMVETIYGDQMVDTIIDDNDLDSKGAYTSVGTYDPGELLQLVSALSNHSGVPVKDLVHHYGHYLFGRFHQLMPQFFKHPKNTFEFLETVHDVIHVEVKKLYPDASLPHFETEIIGHHKMTMTYQSVCPLADFAHGLINGCIDHFNDKITITYTDKNANDRYCRVFTLEKE